MAESTTQTKLGSPAFPDKFYDDPTGLDRYVVQEKILFSWACPSKPDRQRQRPLLMQMALGAVLIIVILALLQEFLLAIVLAMFAVLYFLFETSPPVLLQCHITTIGVKVEDKYYYWPQLSQFWFEEKQGARVLHLRNVYPRLQVVKLIVFPTDEAEITTTMGKYLLFKKPQQMWWEKWLKRLSSYLPLDLDPF